MPLNLISTEALGECQDNLGRGGPIVEIECGDAFRGPRTAAYGIESLVPRPLRDVLNDAGHMHPILCYQSGDTNSVLLIPMKLHLLLNREEAALLLQIDAFTIFLKKIAPPCK